MDIPAEMLVQLEFLCEKNDFGMLVLKGQKFNAIIMGTREFSPDQMSIICAHALLQGVISAELNALNEAAQEKREADPKH